MSAEKIIEQIKKDTEKDIRQILKDANNQAKELINSMKKEAEKEAEKIISDGKKQAENIQKIMISKVNQDAKKEIMRTKEEIINDCFIKAQHELSILEHDRYKKLVKKLIESGKEKLGENCSVKVSRDIDKSIVEEVGLKVSGKTESSGGIIFMSSDKRITLNHTFEAILKREKDKLRIKVGKLLFS
jgi:V/A-type H+/Na+-transporting ATPase subunit E